MTWCDPLPPRLIIGTNEADENTADFDAWASIRRDLFDDTIESCIRLAAEDLLPDHEARWWQPPDEPAAFGKHCLW